MLEGNRTISATTFGANNHVDYYKQIWYFGEKQSWWDRFQGKIPLIFFDMKTVRELTPLIKAMNLPDHLLSATVKADRKIVGLKVLDKEKTDDLRQRAQYFVR